MRDRKDDALSAKEGIKKLVALISSARDGMPAPRRRRIVCWKPDPAPSPFTPGEGWSDHENDMEAQLLEGKPIDMASELLYGGLSVQHTISEEDAGMNTASPEIENGPPACICSCSREFAPYKRGAVTIKKICPDCLDRKNAHLKPSKDERIESERARSVGRKGTEAAGPDEPPGADRGAAGLAITISFVGSDEQIFRRIEALAGRQRRTNAAQVLHWLDTLVPELGADLAEK